MTLTDQHGLPHEITLVEAGKTRPYKGASFGRPRYTMDGATHPKGMPIRFKSVGRLIAWAQNERRLFLSA